MVSLHSHTKNKNIKDMNHSYHKLLYHSALSPFTVHVYVCMFSLCMYVFGIVYVDLGILHTKQYSVFHYFLLSHHLPFSVPYEEMKIYNLGIKIETTPQNKHIHMYSTETVLNP